MGVLMQIWSLPRGVAGCNKSSKSVFERPTTIALHWYEIVLQGRKTLFIDIMDFLHNNITLCSADWFNWFNCLPTNKFSPDDPLKSNERKEYIMKQWICSIFTFCWLDVEGIKITISWCEILLCPTTPTDQWICRNVLEIESQTEYNNQKHWTAKHVLPFQWWHVTFSCACLLNWDYLFKILICQRF